MANSAEHTPGPWHYTPITLGHPDNRINPIVGADQDKTGGVAYICRVGWQGSTIPGMTSLTCLTLEEAEANARLLAQAPNLLAVAEETLTAFENVMPKHLYKNGCFNWDTLPDACPCLAHKIRGVIEAAEKASQA